jgi:hypothetical protein
VEGPAFGGSPLKLVKPFAKKLLPNPSFHSSKNLARNASEFPRLDRIETEKDRL